MEKERNKFKMFADNIANAFSNVDFVTAYPTAGAFGDVDDNSVTVELWSKDAEEMIRKEDFNKSEWSFGWNGRKGRIASFNFDITNHYFERLTEGNIKSFNWAEFVQKVSSKINKVCSFREFSRKLINTFRGARFVTAYPVNGRYAEDGLPERVRFEVWNSDAESTLNCRLFSTYDGWAFSQGRITSFDLTSSPDGTGRNPDFFSEFGNNLSEVDWSEAVIAV